MTEQFKDYHDDRGSGSGEPWAEVDVGEVTAPPSWSQLGILVLDGSASMRAPLAEDGELVEGLPPRTKAAGVDSAVRALLNRMKQSTKRDNFSFALVGYSDKVTVECSVTPLSGIDTNAPFDPTVGGSGGTRIAAGLQRATEIANADFRNG